MPAETTVYLETQVGPVFQADGALNGRLRVGRHNELIVGAGLPPFHELVSRGKVFCACNQAEVTYGTALTATAVTFTLSNPSGSPVNLALLKIGLSTRVCSTPGHLVLAANVNPSALAVVHGTPLVVRNAKLDGSAGYGLADGAATLPAAPVAIMALGTMGTAVGVSQWDVQVDGAVVLGPNTAVTVQGITVVGSGLISMFWAEIPTQA